MAASVEYLQKSKHLQEQLKEMRTEIEVLKIDEGPNIYDVIHDEQVNLGENKYSTFRKVRSSYFSNLFSAELL